MKLIFEQNFHRLQLIVGLVVLFGLANSNATESGSNTIVVPFGTEAE
jgi:hypothetical protein